MADPVDIEDEEPSEEWEAEQRALVQFEIDNPRYDPQVQSDGSYRDAEAERRSRLAASWHRSGQAKPEPRSAIDASPAPPPPKP